MSRHWKQSFCSLDQAIDQDHRAMFKLLDRVATLRREADLDELNLLIDQLLEHTLDHFAREERAMETSNYPASGQHAEEHLAMRKALIEALRKVMKGNLLLPVFVRHLKESFTYHFEKDDMTFICWLQERRERAPRRFALGGA